MNRKLKAIPLALIAVVALSAVAASTARASYLTATEYPATLTGTEVEGEEHVFGLAGSEFECEETEFLGEASEASSEATFEPKYGSCSWSSYSATVSMNGCDYQLDLGEEIEGDPNRYHATMDLNCPEESAVEITTASGKCHLTISAQNALSAVEVKNDVAAEPEDVTINLSVSGIEYSVENTGAPCPLIEGTFENGTYTGSSTVVATNGESESIDVHASTEATTITSSQYPARLTGGQTSSHVMPFGFKSSISCNTVKLAGQLEGASGTVTLSPTYEGCSFLGFLSTVTVNGCVYVIKVESGTTDVSCPKGKAIQFDAYLNAAKHASLELFCRMQILPQEGVEGVQLTNVESGPEDIHITTEASVAVKMEGPIAFCPPTSSVTYKGGTTLRAYSDEAHKNQIELMLD